MTNRTAAAIRIINTLPRQARAIIGHEFDDNGLSFDTTEQTYSPLMRVLSAISAQQPVSASDFGDAAYELRNICLRAAGAADAMTAFGGPVELRDALRAVANLQRTTGLLDAMQEAAGDYTADDLAGIMPLLTEAAPAWAR